MGKSQSRQSTQSTTHAAVKTDREFALEREIEEKKMKLQAERQKIEDDIKKAKADQERDSQKSMDNQRMASQQAIAAQELASKKAMDAQNLLQKQRLDQLEIAAKEAEQAANERKRKLELDEQERKQQLLQPDGQKSLVQKEQDANWVVFGSSDDWPGEMYKQYESTCMIKYQELKDVESVKGHVASLFKTLPPGALKELLCIVEGVIGVVTACDAVVDIVKGERMEKSFNIDDKHLTTRIAYAFSFSKVTEMKCKEAGMMTWFTENSHKPEELMFVAISYKIDIRTQGKKEGAFSAQEMRALESEGYL